MFLFSLLGFLPAGAHAKETHFLVCNGMCTLMGCPPSNPCCNSCKASWQFSSQHLPVEGALPECKVDGCGNGTVKDRLEATGEVREVDNGSAGGTGKHTAFVVESYRVVSMPPEEEEGGVPEGVSGQPAEISGTKTRKAKSR